MGPWVSHVMYIYHWEGISCLVCVSVSVAGILNVIELTGIDGALVSQLS